MSYLKVGHATTGHQYYLESGSIWIKVEVLYPTQIQDSQTQDSYGMFEHEVVKSGFILKFDIQI